VHGGERMGICIPQRRPRMRPLVKSAANTEESGHDDKRWSAPGDSSEDVEDEKHIVDMVMLVELEFSGVPCRSDTTSRCPDSSGTLFSVLSVSRRCLGCLFATTLDSASLFPATRANLATSLDIYLSDPPTSRSLSQPVLDLFSLLAVFNKIP